MMQPQIITITLDYSWKFTRSWTDDLGRRMAEFKDEMGDTIIFEVVDSSAADALMQAARAVQ